MLTASVPELKQLDSPPQPPTNRHHTQPQPTCLHLPLESQDPTTKDHQHHQHKVWSMSTRKEGHNPRSLRDLALPQI